MKMCDVDGCNGKLKRGRAMEEKEYEIPEEIIALWDKYHAAKKMRDILAKLPFGFKKARKCALDAETFNRKFWYKVRELYPEEFYKKGLEFYAYYGHVTILKDKEK